MFTTVLNNESGMTVVEVCVVVIIMLILLNIGVSYFVPVEKRQLQTVADDFKNNVANIQRLAVAEGTDYKIVFDLENRGSYRVIKRNGTDFENVREVHLPGEAKVFDTNAASSVIEFSSRGTVAKASTTIFVNGSYNVAVTCAVGTGKVNIKDVKGKATMYELSDF